MYSVQEDGKESAVEYDEQHAQLDVTENTRGVAYTEYLGDGVRLEDRECERYPRDGAEGSEYFNDRAEEPMEQDIAANE